MKFRQDVVKRVAWVRDADATFWLYKRCQYKTKQLIATIGRDDLIGRHVMNPTGNLSKKKTQLCEPTSKPVKNIPRQTAEPQALDTFLTFRP